MDGKEDGEAYEEQASSPIQVLQEISEEAFKMAGETLQNMYSGNSSMPPLAPGHRRSQSEVVTTRHRRSNSLQKLKCQMQKAFKWGSNSRGDLRLAFNPEVLANQKRQWYQLHSRSKDRIKLSEPDSLFEHFIIAGLHPDVNLEAVEGAFVKRRKWEMDMINSGIVDLTLLQQRGPPIPTLEPQILFKYPPGKRLAMRLKDLAAFCFPGGVKARLMEKTPSLSDLNQVVYGQEHLGKDDLAFIFSLKVADNATLYGICLHVSEIVQRPPAILGISSPHPHSSGGLFRFLVSAPRCYCVLSRVPSFELHYEMLNSIIQEERLNRITQFASEISLHDYVPTLPKVHDEMNDHDDSPHKESFYDWMDSAIPVDSALAFTAAGAGIRSDDETPPSSLKIWEPQSPESVTASESSDFSQVRYLDKDGRKDSQCSDDYGFEAIETHSETSERIYGSYGNGHTSPEVGPSFSSRNRTLESLGSSEYLFRNGHTSPEVGTSFSSRSRTLERLGSSESLFSPARSMVSEDDDDDLFSNCEKEFGDELIMEWARENKNDLLQIVCGFHALPLPQPGSELAFQPLEHLQAIEYRRPPVTALGFDEKSFDSFEDPGVNAKLAAAEEAFALSLWTTATICRVLSLESILALVAGVLLEKQVVVVCPNLGVLSATVLSLIPMIRPFQWQSLMLPVLPGKMLDFLDAPVPFIIGIQQIPADLKRKAWDPVQVNVQKDQVKMCHLPTLPRHKDLASELGPIHARLSREGSFAKKHPVYRCNEVQVEAAGQFLDVMKNYLESLCSELRSYTITSVQSNNDRVSLLLKDSFIDSFPSKDRSFIKLFVDTQMFTVLSDSRLSSFENGDP
ncbi:hypothetical protein PRUPE_8G213500 [Prunus persica]|uniref:UDENN domain-containing protein n=1 Tax=Prunus persica TaxID=3760 RepID=A0A251N171_PRUPE|nr:uncharacterized protein LOC18767999 isoform X1 [Prunus persica]ONH93100.1 hypothetical protein PRUPE_8G213500 [Prunus persica]ONH93101.1 hypothetical protein PRUPE_8G213500 [Prunus persica]ONH93102.1 hypothetical protein PRUPE_8G213500 [Prunus persica]